MEFLLQNYRINLFIIFIRFFYVLLLQIQNTILI